MKKNKVKFKQVAFKILNLEYLHPNEAITKLQESLNEIPEEFRDSAIINKEDDYDGSCDFVLKYSRPMTAEEIEQENRTIERQKEWRRQQFEALKKEFGE